MGQVLEELGGKGVSIARPKITAAIHWTVPVIGRRCERRRRQ